MGQTQMEIHQLKEEEEASVQALLLASLLAAVLW
jgi:hypothetical protein